MDEKFPDSLPNDFDGESDKKEPNDNNDDIEDELVAVSKKNFLKFQSEALMVAGANSVLDKQNRHLIDICNSLVEQVKSTINLARESESACREAIQRNQELMVVIDQLSNALNEKVAFQYLKYFSCIVIGSVLTVGIFLLTKLF